MILVRILALVAGVAVGIGLMKYSYPLTQLFGRNTLAERYLGNGGTYTMWKLLGILVIVIAVWYAFK